MVQQWMFYKGLSILCLGLMRRLFSKDCIFLWNLACVPFSHDEFLAWDSFNQPWFVNDDGFGSISLMVHSFKSDRPMYKFDLSGTVGLLEACIKSNFGYINEYEFDPYNEYEFDPYKVQS